jgi:phage gp45-like
MNIEWLKAKVEQLEQTLGNRIMAMAEWTTLSRTTAVGDKDQANVAANPSDRQRPIRRAAPWGVAGYPPAGVFALVVKAVAGVFNGVYTGIATDKYGPQNLNEGETALYAKPGQLFLLDQNGNIVGTPAGLGTFQAGGNTYSMPQWDAFAAVLKTATAAVAALTPATDLASAVLAINGTLAALKALNTALGANNSYKSTLAKNG